MPASYKVDANVFADYLKNSSLIHARLTAAGKEAVEIWQEKAPVNSGAYRDSIRYKIMRNPTRMKVRVMAIDHKAFWLEFGTAKMAARHPMADTIEEMINNGYHRDGKP